MISVKKYFIFLLAAIAIGFITSCKRGDVKYFRKYKDGRLIEKVSIDENGLYHGVYFKYNLDGTVFKKCIYTHGKLNGECLIFDIEGRTKVETYENDVLVQKTFLNSTGKIEEIDSYIVGTNEINNIVCFDSLGEVIHCNQDYRDKYLRLNGSIDEFTIDLSRKDSNTVELKLDILNHQKPDIVLETIDYTDSSAIVFQSKNWHFVSDTLTGKLTQVVDLGDNNFSIFKIYLQLAKKEKLEQFNTRPIRLWSQ